MADIGDFAGIGLALYAAHHVGDYWIQTDHQARHKGCNGARGVRACVAHVYTYTLTQALFVAVVYGYFRPDITWLGVFLGLAVSAVTHYLADRREHGIMFDIARMFPGKENFLKLGVPRPGRDDNPSLGTGAWALDQAWHIFFGVFVAALLMTSF